MKKLTEMIKAENRMRLSAVITVLLMVSMVLSLIFEAYVAVQIFGILGAIFTIITSFAVMRYETARKRWIRSRIEY
jgi:ABC-type arginine/histidine transport system permease subunit